MHLQPTHASTHPSIHLFPHFSSFLNSIIHAQTKKSPRPHLTPLRAPFRTHPPPPHFLPSLTSFPHRPNLFLLLSPFPPSQPHTNNSIFPTPIFHHPYHSNPTAHSTLPLRIAHSHLSRSQCWVLMDFDDSDDSDDGGRGGGMEGKERGRRRKSNGGKEPGAKTQKT